MRTVLKIVGVLVLVLILLTLSAFLTGVNFAFLEVLAILTGPIILVVMGLSTVWVILNAVFFKKSRDLGKNRNAFKPPIPDVKKSKVNSGNALTFVGGLTAIVTLYMFGSFFFDRYVMENPSNLGCLLANLAMVSSEARCLEALSIKTGDEGKCDRLTGYQRRDCHHKFALEKALRRAVIPANIIPPVYQNCSGDGDIYYPPDGHVPFNSVVCWGWQSRNNCAGSDTRICSASGTEANRMIGCEVAADRCRSGKAKAISAENMEGKSECLTMKWTYACI